MCKAFFMLCAMVLLESGCTGAAEERSSPSDKMFRTFIKLSDDEHPCLGKPIQLTIGLVNEGAKEARVYIFNVGQNASLIVQGPGGKPVPYIFLLLSGLDGPDYQLEPGGTIYLTEDLDLAEQYLIDKPGHYVVRYEGQGLVIDRKPAKVKPCTLEIDVAPGKLDGRMEIAAKLFPLMPKGLSLSMGPRWANDDLSLLDLEVLRYSSLPEERPVLGFEFRNDGLIRRTAELLGKTRWGSLHAFVQKISEEWWPDWRKAVQEAFEVTPP